MMFASFSPIEEDMSHQLPRSHEEAGRIMTRCGWDQPLEDDSLLNAVLFADQDVF